MEHVDVATGLVFEMFEVAGVFSGDVVDWGEQRAVGIEPGVGAGYAPVVTTGIARTDGGSEAGQAVRHSPEGETSAGVFRV